jgi:hypothetical protein
MTRAPVTLLGTVSISGWHRSSRGEDGAALAKAKAPFARHSCQIRNLFGLLRYSAVFRCSTSSISDVAANHFSSGVDLGSPIGEAGRLFGRGASVMPRIAVPS